MMSMNMLKVVFMISIVICAVCESRAPASQTFSQPDGSWNEFQIKSCCPEGWIEVGNYCAKCSAPNVFDPIDNVCKPCPSDHTYSEFTKRC